MKFFINVFQIMKYFLS